MESYVAYKTMQALIIDVERAIYQSAGSAVQLYSQDILMQQVQDAFDHIFIMEWWPQFRIRELRTLDGTTGAPTVPLTYITQYDDIKAIFVQNDPRALPVLTMNSSVLAPNFNIGDRARYMEGNVATVFKLWPETATGQVSVVGRARPAAFAIDQTVPFDSTLLKHYAAWAYFTDDDSNPTAAAKHQGLFETRLETIRIDSRNGNVELDPETRRIPNRWDEYY